MEPPAHLAGKQDRMKGDPIELARQAGVRVEEGAVLANGRLELRRYLREQTVSEVTHRHGILG